MCAQKAYTTCNFSDIIYVRSVIYHPHIIAEIKLGSPEEACTCCQQIMGVVKVYCSNEMERII